MVRWGVPNLPEPSAEVVGLMSHLASADCDPEITETQIRRFREATAPYRHLPRHVANGAVAAPDPALGAPRRRAPLAGRPLGRRPLRRRDLRSLAFRRRSGGRRPRASAPQVEPARRGFAGPRPPAPVPHPAPRDPPAHGRRFVAQRPTWIGIVPVGYADGFRRDLTGTE